MRRITLVIFGVPVVIIPLVPILIVLGIALGEVANAWRGFVSQNETLLTQLLLYAAPLVMLVAVPISCVARDKRLLLPGLLEGAACALLMNATFWLCIHFATPVGDSIYESMNDTGASGLLYILLMCLVPFLIFCLIFFLFPVLGLLFRGLLGFAPEEARDELQRSNGGRLGVVCGVSALLLFLLYVTLNSTDLSAFMFIAVILFNGLFCALAAALMIWLAVKAAGSN